MDTALLCPFGINSKQTSALIGNFLNISVIGVIVCSQILITAVPNEINELCFANAAIQKVNIDAGRQITSEFSVQAKEEKFNKSINEKYPKGLVKDVERGVKHIKVTKYYNGRPVRINIVEADMNITDLTLKPELSSDTLNNRRTIKTIAQKSSSVAALNGTYFKPQTGVPLGTLMIDKKLVTGPIYDRVALGVFDKGFDVARVSIDAKIQSDGKTIKIDNINQPRMLSSYTLIYTPEWGKSSPPSPKYGIQVVVENERVTAVTTSQSVIPKNGYVIVGQKSVIGSLKVGSKIIYDVKTLPEWKNVKHIISGGPYLVKDNEIYVDITAQKLTSITGRNPRSAIGYTADNRLIMVAVDGREGASIGLTLSELAGFMKSIGCINAINLDGGGSTVMYVKGNVVNNPKVAGGIPISNAVVLSTR